MTGMDDNGAKGMKEMSDAGAYTIPQNEKIYFVYGMPNAVLKIGRFKKVLPLELIAREIFYHCY